jgi:hypothetical protein
MFLLIFMTVPSLFIDPERVFEIRISVEILLSGYANCEEVASRSQKQRVDL